MVLVNFVQCFSCYVEERFLGQVKIVQDQYIL